ncbi:muts domain V-domain-containing protein [Kockovaella imperatae]|uniref:DNA mismatch repair protein n=1 Tax=Kockovaella imperatae TaxID=4999 RepID=A0A1Y1U696_9TREE|nr:muts domain V-domain-containing protein [Kockovaella imperatae]ORX33553.1 muts domain V-domain-containing protein [Kockovaella imperatae]
MISQKPLQSKLPAKRKSLQNDSDSDDFMLDLDDDVMMEAADEYEASVMSDSPGPPLAKSVKRSKGFAQPAKSAPKPSTSLSRPPPRPFASSSKGGSRAASDRSDSRAGSDVFLTLAELRKEEDKDAKKEGGEVFPFLKKPRDAQGRYEDDPDYDKRTLLIEEHHFKDMTPFEKQFWWIKRWYYDTVLFFQKGYFYELYENDAEIGHREFDLKLTSRVKMKMVGVPEQQFEIWAAKFLAAGYKVGRVDQKETAIGMDMRTQKDASKKTASTETNAKAVKGKEVTGRDLLRGPNHHLDGVKIVQRELSEVFTNGTIVDGAYLASDESNHCVALKESVDPSTGLSNFGVCILDASTGVFDLAYLEDDIVNTNLETLFRQIRPKELLYAKSNLSVNTQRLLRAILPASTLWESFQNVDQFYTRDETLRRLAETYQLASDPDNSGKPILPEAIQAMSHRPLAMEAFGGMMYYIETMNLGNDLLTQKNFNVYDPIRQGKSMILDGHTLNHMEVLTNNEGGEEGTLLALLQQCSSPFGKRLFRHWLIAPLRDVKMINDRLDAVDELLANPGVMGDFTLFAKKLPDLERMVSRIHAGALKQRDFDKVVAAFSNIKEAMDRLSTTITPQDARTVHGILRAFPDIGPHVRKLEKKYTVKTEKSTFEIIPQERADEDCSAAQDEIDTIKTDLEEFREKTRRSLGLSSDAIKFWHSAQGGREIYQLEVPSSTKMSSDRWIKQSGTQKVSRYYSEDLKRLVRELLEAQEKLSTAKQGFYGRLMAEFDQDRDLWLKAIKLLAELDCLISLARASHNMDEPKCRPTFVDSPVAFIDFEDLRHPSMCLRSDFIPNNVQLGGNVPRTTLLTGPNMAGKSTLLRMTAAGIIMAQMGCYVPASKAVLSPVDKIQTRMGAYDNMFAAASTFKVELDECARILREAGPRSFVILDELGRGTSTFDGMAIAGAVLHHLATHTLPLGFFATHYGSLTDDYTYHPNIRRMHMKTHVDDEQHQVVFLYKLVPGVAESSHGTHVATMAGVPSAVVSRADQVSAEFFEAFKAKLATRRQSSLSVEARSDIAWLIKLALNDSETQTGNAEQAQFEMDMVRAASDKIVEI